MNQAASAGESAFERVGKAVADRRVEVGFETQRELAEAAEVSLNTAALLERGKSFPHRVNRIKFEDALQWPRGTLDALRRGEPVPQAPTPRAPTRAVVEFGPPQAGARTDLQALAIAKAVAAIAATCTQVLVGQGSDPTAHAALRELEDQLLQLESLIAASLPHVAGTSFSETMSALTELHQYRDVIRDAAATLGRGDAATESGAAPRTRLASARS